MMRSLIRIISVALRKRSERKVARSLTDQFYQYLIALRALPTPSPKPNVVALVRLDDIGDYLLWRNFLPAYREYYSDKHLLLVGNKVWEPVFHALDRSNVDQFVALDKGRYNNDATYRMEFWAQMRNLGISELLCVSRTRPLLLDDCITIAAAAPLTIAAENNFSVDSWNRMSDEIYGRLIPAQHSMHEFSFNGYFAQTITQALHIPSRLTLDMPDRVPHNGIVCFIGASAKSKRWPTECWISLLRSLKQEGFEPILSGGPSEADMAKAIESEVSVDNKVGHLSLMQTLQLIAGSRAVVTGDTMAAHAAVGAFVPTVILANGVNASRFVSYPSGEYKGVTTLYSDAFRRYRGVQPFIAVSSDMASILPEEVLQEVFKLLQHTIPNN